jgi:hypothetical protein
LILIAEQILWNSWCEEWVVLYDDSTMAWFTVSTILFSHKSENDQNKNDKIMLTFCTQNKIENDYSLVYGTFTLHTQASVGID